MTQAEINKYRNRVPEPSWTEYSVVRFIIDKPFDVSVFTDPKSWEEVRFETIETGEFVKIKCRTNGGCLFEAWSKDGKTPIFPGQIE